MFSLGQQNRAVLSHHLGDLDHYEAYRAFERDVELYERLFEIRPALLVHDLHPDYASTRYALARAEREGLKTLGVQHHHAHLAGCLAEHGLCEPAIGVIFDGAGYGPDGTIWGGEFLVGDLAGFRRAAHLRSVALPGGEQAVREPWRMAVAHLCDAGVSRSTIVARQSSQKIALVEQMIERRLNTPMTSSAGRLFDAVASLAGVRDISHYEGQAAQELEWLATQSDDPVAYPFQVCEAFPLASEPCLELDSRPLIAAVANDTAEGVSPRRIARRFHHGLVQGVVEVVRRLGEATGLARVALSGGVFANALLLSEAAARLASDGFQVLRHERTPPGDGGLSFGQLAVAGACSSSAAERTIDGSHCACA